MFFLNPGEIIFNDIFYSTHYSQNVIILTYYPCQATVNEILHSFLYLVFEICCVFCTYSTSQFGLATFQVLNNHMWLVAAT